MIAAIRPTDWNWLLLGHISSAMILVGGLIVVTLAALAALRKAPAAALLQAIAFWVNLALVIPAFIAVHVFGGILSDREYDNHTPHWLDTAFAVTTVATIVAIVLAGLQFWVLRRARSGRPGGWQPKLTAALGPLLLAAMVAVIVLMAGKPS
jgi:hypothetical protein